MRLIVILALPLVPAVPYLLLSPPTLGASAPQFEPPESSRFSSSLAPADSSRRAPTPFSEKAIRERSKGWEVLNLETPRWKLMMTDMFAIRSDAPVDELRTAGVYLEEFLKVIRSTLGGDPSEFRFSVRMFREERAFRVYAQVRGVPNAESFYDPQGVEIVVHLKPDEDAHALATSFMHELSHQYLHRVFRMTRPLWFTEGLSEYFAAYVIKEGRVVPGAENAAHRDRLRANEPLPLRRLLVLSRDEFYSDDIFLAYAQSWSLVRHLLSRRADVHDDLLGALLRGVPLGDLVPLDEIEEEWRKTLGE